jgi:hypothetical protein
MTMLLLSSVGIVVLAIGAAQAQRWSERIMIMGAYAASGAVFAEILQHLDDRRCSGLVLLRLGPVIPQGAAIVQTVGGVVGLMGLTLSLFFEPQIFGVATLVGWYLLFISMAARYRFRWLITQFGFLGLGILIPWPDITEYKWTETGGLSLTTSSRPRPLTLWIPPRVRDHVEGILKDQLLRQTASRRDPLRNSEHQEASS